jgi:uncharacterized membrane protein YhaH (DUF805 family)
MNPNMSPVDFAKRPLQKYADFSGRAPRAEYWWYTLAIIIVALVLSIVEGIVGISRMVGPYGPLSALLMLATIVPSLAVGVRRLHDTNRSGWWMLLLVPYFIAAFLAGRSMASGNMSGLGTAGLLMLVGGVLCIVLLIFMVLPSTPGDNQYGPNPYGGAGAVAAE